MAFLDDVEKKRIAEAIGEVEKSTTGELVTVIAGRSDAYLFIPSLWAAAIALLAPALIWVLPVGLNPLEVYTAQIATFVVLALLFRWMPLRMKLVPKAVKHGRAARCAREQFFEQGLHMTAGRTGMLLFVSAAERYVEVLADAGIDDRVDDAVWQGAVDDFTSAVKAGRIADGFLAAIEACGAVLRENFPADPANYVDELPNHLIEI